MKTTVNEYHFMNAFEKIRPDNFSTDGLRALFEYLEDYEDSTGEEIELDVIGLCCDFSEYEDMAAFRADYGDEYETLDDVRDQTTVIEIDVDTDDEGNEDGSFIIQCF